MEAGPILARLVPDYQKDLIKTHQRTHFILTFFSGGGRDSIPNLGGVYAPEFCSQFPHPFIRCCIWSQQLVPWASGAGKLEQKIRLHVV